MQANSAPKTRKKIGFVVTKGVWGGAQKYVYNLAVNIPKEDFDVFVICGEGKILKEKLEEREIRVYELPDLKRDLSIALEVKSSFSLLKIVWKERPDILHLNSPKAAGFGSVAGRLCGTPKIIQTIHGWSFNEKRGALSKFLILFFSWLTVFLCHKTIVIAESEMQQALKMPLVTENKITLIKNGIEQIKFKEKKVARKDLMFRAGKLDVGNALWLGVICELHKNKGLSYAIEAVSKIKTPLVFFIIGEGEEREKLEKLIVEKHLENQVFLLGFMDEANLNLKAFDIFLLTSIKEGLPYTILEAGQASLPVIASSIGGIPNIINSGVTGILTAPTKTNEITQAIEYVVNLKDQKVRLGEKLKEKVAKEFSLAQMVEKTLKLYES